MITPLPLGEGKGEGPLTHIGISVITPLPSGEGKGEGPAGDGGGAAIFLTPVCSVHLCFSVRNRMYPLDE